MPLSNYHFFPEHVRFYVHPLRMSLYFLQPPYSLVSKPCSLQMFWGLIYPVQDT